MRHLAFRLLAASTPLLAACTNDSDLLATDDNTVGDPSLHTATLVFSGAIDRFDAETRAVTSDWDDGATIYIQYQTTRGSSLGRATYKAGQWTVNYGNIKSGEQGQCEVRYFDNPQAASYPTSVTLTEQSAVFADTQGTYQLEDGVMKVTAHLKPLTGRLRLRGTAGQTVSFTGLKWYTAYNLSANTLSATAGRLTLTVAANGYTPYVYAAFDSDTDPQLSVEDADGEAYSYVKYFDSSVLATGKSGYLNIPTIDQYNGWDLVDAHDPLGLCPDNKHPHTISMGDGLKWACCNVGAKSPVEYGDYFAWGETATKSTYDWSTYKYCQGSSTTMTKYCNSSSYGTVDNKAQLEPSDDAARANWGGTWRMPTIDELAKLNANCTWTWTTVGGVNGYKVTATNGNTLFFPAAGFRSEATLSNGGSRGYYWSSSLGTSSASNARELYFNSSDRYTDYYSNRYYGRSVRPVTE